MEKLTYRFTLDTHKPGIQRVLQGFETADSLARAIEVTLTEGSESFNFTNNITAMLYIKGIDIPRACDIEDGIISYTFQNADITEEGSHECQIKIIETSVKGAKRVIASPRFEVEVWESNVSDIPAEATDAFTALEAATAKAIAAYNSRITSFEFDENFVLTVKYGVNEDGTQVVYTTDIFKTAIEAIQPTVSVGNVYESNEMKVEGRGTPTDLILDFYLKRGERGFTGMTGPKGDTGAQGPTGRTATVTVGTVSDGDHASIINVGTDNDAVFNIVLPRGERGPQGDKGADGTSFTIKGLYATFSDLVAAHPTGSAGEAYAVGNSTSNVIYNWNVDTNAWDNIGSIQGPKGLDGQAATIQIGSVTQGATASVVNTGTAQDAVLAFTLPKGDRGDDGKDGSDGKDGTQVSVDSLSPTGIIIATIYIDGVPYTIKAPITKIDALNDINDVNITDVQDGDTLIYDAATRKWKNGSVSSGVEILVDLTDESLIGSTIRLEHQDTAESHTHEVYTKVSTEIETIFNCKNVGFWTVTVTTTDGDVYTAEVEADYYGFYHCVIGGDIHINLTYDDVFVGKAFHLTNGDKTYNKTASVVGGTLTWVVNDPGDWTIWVSSDGTRFEVSIPGTEHGGSYNEHMYQVLDGETAEPINDVSKWLMCSLATISTRYTTLTEVLEDTATLNALLNDDNANKYLVRSTGFASDCAADEAFCTYLGLCDDATVRKILSNETWVNAICNSTYYDKILTESVPTMTSNTAPKGEVIFSSYLGSGTNPGLPWKAFDGNEGDRWATSDTGATGTTTLNAYIGYKFENPIIANKFVCKVTDNNKLSTIFKVQGSNDKTTWEDLTENIDIPYTGDKYSVAFVNNNSYQYYRMFVISQTQNTAVRFGFIGSVQFIGRQVSA